MAACTQKQCYQKRYNYGQLNGFYGRVAMPEDRDFLQGHNFQRIRWHSRRGLLELDLILVPFAEKHFLSLSREDQDRYAKLLASEDQDLLAWLLEHEQPTDPDITSIIQLIRKRHGSATANPD
jgi:antitoxin CptB